MRRIWGMSIAGLALSALAGLGLGVAGFGLHFADATAYLSDDPAACVNCHVMNEQYDGWLKSRHHAVATCNDCHVPQDVIGKYLAKTEHGYRHSKAFTLQNFHEPIRITPADRGIVIDNCLRCHADMASSMAVVHSAPAGAATEVADCTRCHVGVGHGAR